MKIAIFSEHDKSAHDGTLQLLTKYASKSPDVIFPVTADNVTFATSVAQLCKQLGIHTTAYTDHEFTLSDMQEYSNYPNLSVLHQLNVGDAVGIMWSDSEEDHFILHNVEDLALDVWDITNGLAVIETHSVGPLDADALRDAMMDSFEDFVDIMATYIAAQVLNSLGQAMDEHMRDAIDKKDISPFDEGE